MGNIELVEYNQEKKLRECIIGECEAQIETAKSISRHRRIHRSEQYFGPTRQEMACPYCSKKWSALELLFAHVKVRPQGGSRDIETCTEIHTQDTPRDKWAKILLRMKGIILEIQLQEMKYPQQPREELYTKASDRMREGDGKRRIQKEKMEINIERNKAGDTAAERTRQQETGEE